MILLRFHAHGSIRLVKLRRPFSMPVDKASASFLQHWQAGVIQASWGYVRVNFLSGLHDPDEGSQSMNIPSFLGKA